MKNRKIYAGCIIAAGCFWGVMGLFVRGLSKYGFDSLQISALRLISGAAMLVLFALIRDRSLFRIELKDLPIFLAMGILSILGMSWLYFSSIVASDLSVAAILLYTAPFWVLAASVFFYGEKLNIKKIIALILAFGGCVAVSGLSAGAVSKSGILFGLGSGLAYALYSIFGKLVLKKYSPITITVYSFVVAAVGSVFLCRPCELFQLAAEMPPVTLILETLGIGFVTVFMPYLLYTYGLSKTQAGRAAIMASVEPMVATIAGFVVFGERPEPIGFIGIILILTAVVLLNIGEKEKILDK